MRRARLTSTVLSRVLRPSRAGRSFCEKAPGDGPCRGGAQRRERGTSRGVPQALAGVFGPLGPRKPLVQRKPAADVTTLKPRLVARHRTPEHWPSGIADGRSPLRARPHQEQARAPPGPDVPWPLWRESPARFRPRRAPGAGSVTPPRCAPRIDPGYAGTDSSPCSSSCWTRRCAGSTFGAAAIRPIS